MGRRVGAIGDHGGARLVGGGLEPRRRGVVAVDDRRPSATGGRRRPCPGCRRPARERAEQLELGGAIRLERAVELEVLVGEVGEHGGVPGHAEHAVERQRVGGGLDHRGGVARPGHRRERRLQLGRAGRGDVRRVPVAQLADLCLDGPDQAGRQARGLERGDGEERGRGLAVRARDPDRAERPRRVAVPPARGPGRARRARRRPRAAAGRRRSPGARRAPLRRRPPRPTPRTRGRPRGTPAGRRTGCPRGLFASRR